MDGYRYTTKDDTTYYNGIEPRRDDDWKKPSSGHVCRPVIIDAEGRKQPIIRYTPTTHKTETYSTETYVEHVAGMQPAIDQVRTTTTTTTQTNPLSTVFRRHTASNSPTKGYNNTIDGNYDDYNDYNNKKNGGGRDGYYRRRDDDPVVLHEQPMGTNHGGRDGYYRRRDNDPVVHEQSMVTNHGGRDGYYRRKDDDPVHEQPMVTNHGGWTRPTRDGWSVPPPSHDSSLTKPMNEAATAIEYLKEAEGGRERITTPTSYERHGFKISVPRRSPESYPVVTTVAAAETVIDSSEAKRRYGKLNNHNNNNNYGGGERENYTTSVDSGEAMRRYNGRVV